MGFDATTGNQPRGTVVSYNFVREVGLWTKQNSFYFQSESFGNTIEGNIAFNGPRAGVNFDGTYSAPGFGDCMTADHDALCSTHFCRASPESLLLLQMAWAAALC